MQKATIQLETLTCPSCALKIGGAVKLLPGVEKESVNVMFNSSKVKVSFDESKLAIADIEKAIVNLGYDIKKTVVQPE